MATRAVQEREAWSMSPKAEGMEVHSGALAPNQVRLHGDRRN